MNGLIIVGAFLLFWFYHNSRVFFNVIISNMWKVIFFSVVLVFFKRTKKFLVSLCPLVFSYNSSHRYISSYEHKIIFFFDFNIMR